MRHTPIPASVDEVARDVVDAALCVHRAIGPGLLESAYEEALELELRARGRDVERQAALRASYRGQLLQLGYRIDLLVDSAVVVELKAVERLLPIHVAQLLTYLRLSDHRLGILVNFNVQRLRDGLKRVAL